MVQGGLCRREQRDICKGAARAVGGAFPDEEFRGVGHWVWMQTLRAGAGGAGGGALPAPWTHLLGAELLLPDGGTQQGPKGTQELPPRPVLDRQEHSHVLLDALGSQPVNLQGRESGN